MNAVRENLPTYPPNVQGELRVILQTKDIFLVCYRQLEEYRRLVNEQNRLITKEFVQEQLQIGEDEIAELKIEFSDAEGRLGARLHHNELLADQLARLGYGALESGASVRHLALVRSPQMRKTMLANRKNGGINSGLSEQDPRPAAHMIDNIALAISEIHQEVRVKVKPLLDYYRDLFYLQLHFSLILGQVCNYCMPLVTENIGLIDRIFFWSERPEFDLVRRAGDISDRLKEIYTRAQTVLAVLTESVRFLQSKVELQKSLETRFHERLDEQQKTKDKILREIHTTKQNKDLLEEENDRLVGSLVKVDPNFVDTRQFVELAEGINVNQTPRGRRGFSPTLKDTTQNNQATQSPHRSEGCGGGGGAGGGGGGGTTVYGQQTTDHSDALVSSRHALLADSTHEMNNNKAVSLSEDVHRIATSGRPKDVNGGVAGAQQKRQTHRSPGQQQTDRPEHVGTANNDDDTSSGASLSRRTDAKTPTRSAASDVDADRNTLVSSRRAGRSHKHPETTRHKSDRTRGRSVSRHETSFSSAKTPEVDRTHRDASTRRNRHASQHQHRRRRSPSASNSHVANVDEDARQQPRRRAQTRGHHDGEAGQRRHHHHRQSSKTRASSRALSPLEHGNKGDRRHDGEEKRAAGASTRDGGSATPTPHAVGQTSGACSGAPEARRSRLFHKTRNLLDAAFGGWSSKHTDSEDDAANDAITSVSSLALVNRQTAGVPLEADVARRPKSSDDRKAEDKEGGGTKKMKKKKSLAGSRISGSNKLKAGRDNQMAALTPELSGELPALADDDLLVETAAHTGERGSLRQSRQPSSESSGLGDYLIGIGSPGVSSSLGELAPLVTTAFGGNEMVNMSLSSAMD